MTKKFTKRFHVSWLVMWFATGVIVGLASAPLILSTSEFHPWMAALCAIGVMTALSSKSFYSVVGILCLGIIFGHARGIVIHPRIADYQPHYGNQVRVYGIVHNDVVSSEDGKQRMQLGHEDWGSKIIRAWLGVNSVKKNVTTRRYQILTDA